MNCKILIVDDEHDIREALARHYRLDGCAVTSAENGEDAMEKLRSEPFHVVISDILMPRMDGIDLLKRVRTEFPMTRVIMITGYVTLDNALACMRHGADTCIFKPLIDLAELDDAVSAATAHLARWERKFLELRGMRQ